MMNEIYIIYVLLIAPLTDAHRTKYRVMQTIRNTKNKYPYVIALLSDDYRIGTGTLLTRRWVLSCAHCVEDITHIQYGNMLIPAELSNTKSKVIKKVKYPGYQIGELSHEIGLCRVTPVPLQRFGKLSTILYSSLVGHPVTYAGYGSILLSNVKGGQLPLQVHEAIVIPCERSCLQGTYLCVSVDNIDIKYQDLTEAYTGGPVFSYGEIVGIVSYGIIDLPPGRITAVLPYLKWINDVVSGRIK